MYFANRCTFTSSSAASISSSTQNGVGVAGALLRSLLDQPAEPRPVPARLTEPLPANDGRELHCGVRLSREGGELYAEPVRTKSGLISALAASDGVLRVPRDCEGLPRGALVEVELEEF